MKIYLLQLVILMSLSFEVRRRKMKLCFKFETANVEIFEEKLGNLTDSFEDYDYESPEGVT